MQTNTREKADTHLVYILYDVIPQLGIDLSRTSLVKPWLCSINLYHGELALRLVPIFGRSVQYTVSAKPGNSSGSIWDLANNSPLGQIAGGKQKDYEYHIVTTDDLAIAEGPSWVQGAGNPVEASQA